MNARVDELLADPPLLHFWGGQSQEGGCSGAVGRGLVDAVSAHVGDRDWSALETGAGLSTLLFLAMGASKVVSVAPDVELKDRIVSQATRLALPVERLEYHAVRSEVGLPSLTGPFDVVLIDGGHGWPTVFVDFAYGNAALSDGGLLLIDDTQLYSVGELYRLLQLQPGYRQVLSCGKLKGFVRETKQKWLPDFGAQPYIKQMRGA